MLYTAIRLNHVTNKSINSTIYIYRYMKYHEIRWTNNSRLFIVISPAGGSPGPGGSEETAAADGDESGAPFGGYHGGRKSHDFLIFCDFGKISHGFFLRFSWFPVFFLFFPNVGKKSMFFSRIFQVQNKTRKDFPNGKCMRWFSQRVSFNDFP